MSGSRHRLPWLLLLVPVLSTSACSVVGTYAKCGLHGCPGDADITLKVQASFERHPELEPPNLITVQTFDRVVYLYGVVDTDLERLTAEDVALQAPGVVRVVDSIGLSGNGTR